MGIFLTTENKTKEYGNGSTRESGIGLFCDDNRDDYFSGNQFLVATFSALNY